MDWKGTVWLYTNKTKNWQSYFSCCFKYLYSITSSTPVIEGWTGDNFLATHHRRS